jgi:hypothetical protein
MPLALEEHRPMAEIGDYVPATHAEGSYLVRWFCCACAEHQRVGVLRGYKAERVRERRLKKAKLRAGRGE